MTDEEYEQRYRQFVAEVMAEGGGLMPDENKRLEEIKERAAKADRDVSDLGKIVCAETWELCRSDVPYLLSLIEKLRHDLKIQQSLTVLGAEQMQGLRQQRDEDPKDE